MKGRAIHATRRSDLQDIAGARSGATRAVPAAWLSGAASLYGRAALLRGGGDRRAQHLHPYLGLRKRRRPRGKARPHGAGPRLEGLYRRERQGRPHHRAEEYADDPDRVVAADPEGEDLSL